MSLEMKLDRFDEAFAEAEADEIPDLKQNYPYLFPNQYPDSVWVIKLNDSLQKVLRKEVSMAFTDFEEEKADIELLFKHITYYFPEYPAPRIITVTNDVDYEDRVILADSLLLIGLDNYLGPEHRFYSGIDRYIAQNLDKQYLTSDVAGAFAKKVIPYPRERSFLAQMVYYGKELYLKDLLLPLTNETQRIGYTRDELDWARANEEQIWRYFIEGELLYSTDQKLGPRFLDPAPFSKFRLELDNESPGRLGRYIGWQIVKAYMENNEVSLNKLLQIPEEEIFVKSKYKPKK